MNKAPIPRIAIAEIGYDITGRLLKRAFNRCIKQAGGEAVWILSPAERKHVIDTDSSEIDFLDFDAIAEEFDGFLFPGGSDINPAIYGADVSPSCGKLNKDRDRLEPPMIRAALKKDKPVLGICRGFQLINAVLGGTLCQDLKTELPESSRIHTRFYSFLKPVHNVSVTQESRLCSILGREILEVNSVHHQTIKSISKVLIPSAVSPDGIIEGFESTGHRFLVGVQWHPEVLTGPYPVHRRIFEAFVKASSDYRSVNKNN